MLSDWSYALAVLVLATAAVTTRFAGALLMAWIPQNPKVERFLEGLSVSVIAALVASFLVSADIKTLSATLAAVSVMALLHNVILAMLAGMLIAAAYPFVVPS